MRWRRQLVIGLLCGLAPLSAIPYPPQLGQAAPLPAATSLNLNSQVQVSQQFLRVLLEAKYAAAYRFLAPEVRRAVSLNDFRQLARPAVGRGQRRGTRLELYKLGVRLDEAGAGGQPFVAFAWTADSASAKRMPPEWLEVTFRDVGARQVLGFALRKLRN